MASTQLSSEDISSLPIHGNYHNYHGYLHRRPGASDPRLRLLPAGLFEDARVLDVGCNEGWVSCEIAQSLGARQVVGVDIDEVLVRMAWKRRRTLWSLQAPPRDLEPADERPKKRQKADDKEDDTARSRASALPRSDYFPASCVHMSGLLPVPESVAKGELSSHESVFPHNATFRCTDWVNKGIPEDGDGYNIVVAFSVSKWIHLNGGDDGLRWFFRRVYESLVPGGTFVFEPQQWDSYTKARKLHTSLQENAKNLKLRPENFQGVLEEIGFEAPECLGPGVLREGRFQRPVELYKKPLRS